MKLKEVLNKTGIGKRHFQYLLAGERNASPKLARRLEAATGISKSIWVFGVALERRALWEEIND